MYVVTQNVFQEDPALTTPAFNRLLEWLDNGVDSHGETYLEMHRRLVSYFDRRNRSTADDLADETFTRIARTLEKDGAIAITHQRSIAIRSRGLSCWRTSGASTNSSTLTRHHGAVLSRRRQPGASSLRGASRSRSNGSSASSVACRSYLQNSVRWSSSTIATRAVRESSAGVRWRSGWASR